jgi:fumarate reductase flavoprotein subunit
VSERLRESRGTTRREFLKRGGFVAGAAFGVTGLTGGLFGCSQAPTAESVGEQAWDKEAEVVIVGGGGTGLAAAAEAALLGNQGILVIEKASDSGGCTRMSGGLVQAAGTALQKELSPFQDDTPEKHFEYWRLAGEGNIDEELIRDLANSAPGQVAWLEERGIKYIEIHGVAQIPYIPEEYMAWRLHAAVPPAEGTGGVVHTDALRKTCDDQGVEFLFDTAGKELVVDAEHGVIGVIAEGNGNTLRIKAKRGVLLATSSMDHNEDLAKAMNPQLWFDIQNDLLRTPATNTGDGILMAMKAGAALAGPGGTMSVMVNCAGVEATAPRPPQLLINGAGRRFVCESATYAYASRAIFQETKRLGHPCFLVFGDSATKPPAEGSWTNPENLQKALDAGSLKTVNNIEELALALDVDAGNLRTTFDEWNNDISAYGQDRAFNRDSGLVPIDAPYYYQECTFNDLGGTGGVKINVDAQVIDTKGNPIPRLFAGGLTAGGWIGGYYPGSGTAVLGTVHWGRKAANSILALEPWD